jgi:UDP-glucose:(heptosyl)LPS alpha-1,3-glucosyltransferase
MPLRKPILAVVSPFIDKSHGTERQVAEWTSQLLDDFEVHVYSQRVEDMDFTKFRWHRIPQIPGPHLLNFSWWFVANHLWRWWDRRIRGISHDIVYTPGTNCLDADAISVHIVFAEFLRHMGQEIGFRRNSMRSWPWLIHRRLYYSVVKFLERQLYTKPRAQLIVYARKTENDINRFYGPHDPIPVVYIGVDHRLFNPESRLARRRDARRELGIGDEQIVLLLVGNDWRKKGLFTLLEALARLSDLPVLLMIAGNDERHSYESSIKNSELTERVRFLPTRPDVAFYYAAADAYVGPSLEDTFALPPEEAMACGLPVITTLTNGTSEIMTDGVDGFILTDPSDVGALASKIRLLCENSELRQRIGDAAALTARKYTWERNGQQFREIFAEILHRKENLKPSTLRQES